jgi:hypothetical protein
VAALARGINFVGSGSGSGVLDKKQHVDDKRHALSSFQKFDWILGWVLRHLKRFCSNVVSISLLPSLHKLLTTTTPPSQRLQKCAAAGVVVALLSLTVILVGLQSSRRSPPYNFQIVFPNNAPLTSGTMFRYPVRNITFPSEFFHEGLDVASLSASPGHPFQRIIQASDNDIAERQRSDILTSGGDNAIPYQYWYSEDIEGLHQFSCRRPSWTKLQFLNCNTFHEMSLSRDYQDKGSEARLKAPNYQEFDNYLTTHGYYRDVWVNSQPVEGTTTILKTTRFQFDFGWRNLLDVHREALIMERLTMFPNIVTAYGHCGTSVLTEALPYEVERYVVPGTGYKNKQPLLYDESNVNSQNKLTAHERLVTALEMAESIAVLHGFADGVIVHDDIQLQQWLRAADGTLKLGDFNRATILDWNDKEKRYCKYSNGETFGNVSYR